MTRAEAAARVAKLRNMTEARGATPNEARVAERKIAALEARFGPVHERARDRPAPRVWQAAPAGGVWSFDPASGRASANVTVHRYNSRADWHIEIFM